jgi:hypothetical protein
MFTLNDNLLLTLETIDEPFVKDIRLALRDFASLYDAVKRKNLRLYYITDQKFRELFIRMRKADLRNRLSVSYMIRLVEGFRVMSVLRSGALVKSIVDCLNNEDVLASRILARSLLELVVRNQEAANVIYHFMNRTLAWDRFNNTVLGFGDFVENGRQQEGIVTYIEKLIFGSRLKELVGTEGRPAVKNIITIMQSVDKKLQAKASYGFYYKYEQLCEIAHPNRPGFRDILVGRAECRWILECI